MLNVARMHRVPPILLPSTVPICAWAVHGTHEHCKINVNLPVAELAFGYSYSKAFL
jgi:hypothetical protein